MARGGAAAPVRDEAAWGRVLDLVDASAGPVARFVHYPAARKLLAHLPALTSGPLRSARVLAGLGAAAAVAFTHERVALLAAFLAAEAGLVLERAGSLVATKADRRLDIVAAWTARVALVVAMASRAPANPRTAMIAALTIALGALAASTATMLRRWVIRRGARDPGLALRALATGLGFASFDAALPILHVGVLGALFLEAEAAAAAYLGVTWIACGALALLVISGDRAGERATAGPTARSGRVV
jgi:hypothetical protein